MKELTMPDETGWIVDEARVYASRPKIEIATDEYESLYRLASLMHVTYEQGLVNNAHLHTRVGVAIDRWKALMKRDAIGRAAAEILRERCENE